MKALRAMEGLETKKEGIFVMPVKRVTIFSTFMMYMSDPQNTLETAWSFRECGVASSVFVIKVAAVSPAVWQHKSRAQSQRVY
jgi:hypothetical protein